jgi:two-component system OmpR family response regulator
MESGDSGRILLLEPEAALREQIATLLARHGFTIQPAQDLTAAESMLEEDQIDIVILGAHRPDTDSLAFCRRVAGHAGARVILVSGQATEVDRVVALEFGADDVLGKPVSPRELLARVRALRRRQGGGRESASQQPVYVFDRFVLDVARRELRVQGGESLVLQANVMELLQVFVEHPKRILSRDELIATAGLDPDIDARAVDMRVSRVRQTLRVLGDRDLIRTVRGSGYVLDAEVNLGR